MESSDLIIKPKRPKGEDGYKTFSVRMREETVSRLEEIVRKTGRSRNELISLFVEFALDKCVIEDSND